ncbi:MAG: PqqD family protein [Thermaerobacter sp.]|nr:PqqD family protein [Thermaerobacter sp.]
MRALEMIVDEQPGGVYTLRVPEIASVFVTNQLGVDIVGKLVDADLSADEVVAWVRVKYPDVPAARAESDVRAFLSRAREKGVVLSDDAD